MLPEPGDHPIYDQRHVQWWISGRSAVRGVGLFEVAKTQRLIEIRRTGDEIIAVFERDTFMIYWTGHPKGKLRVPLKGLTRTMAAFSERELEMAGFTPEPPQPLTPLQGTEEVVL